MKNSIAEAENFVIRFFNPSDIGAYHLLHSDESLLEFETQEVLNKTESEQWLSHWLSEYELWDYQLGAAPVGIATKSNNELIGFISLHFLDSNSEILEMGVRISKEHQNQKIATESCKKLIEVLFAETETKRIQAITNANNLPCIQLFKTLGFTQEGLLRQSVKTKTEVFNDQVVFGVLKSDL